MFKTIFISLLLFFTFLVKTGGNNIALADTYTGVYKNCVAIPSVINPGGSITFRIETKKPVALSTNTLVTNKTTGEQFGSKIAPGLDEKEKKTVREITLGPFDKLGSYSVKSIWPKSPSEECQIDQAFSVKSPSTNVILLQPKSPVDENLTTLPTIQITGLDPNKTYNIKLQGWKGDDLDGRNANGKDWKAPGGTLTANNICNNGQANRTDCTETFGQGNYSLLIKEKNGPDIALLSFKVGTFLSGENPCVGGSCETALGKISTDPADFVTKILGIAIGLAGGIALIFMVTGAIKVLTSSGDQQKLTGGKDMIVAAVSGLLFLILSVLILRFIGSTFLGGLI